jgi:hypothetical protein
LRSSLPICIRPVLAPQRLLLHNPSIHDVGDDGPRRAP